MLVFPLASARGLVLGLAVLLALLFASSNSFAAAVPRSTACWRVEDLKPGLKGYGRTVMKGNKIESFDVEILGVMRNSSPSRDLILARLSGLNLDKTGVIAGMSGSPVYIDDKLVGAVAYAWSFGKEPIAGITPFCQMQGFVDTLERRELTRVDKPVRMGLASPIMVGGKAFEAVTLSADCDSEIPEKSDSLWMTPLRTPLAATGFTSRSLNLFAKETSKFGLVPVMGGAVKGKVADEAKEAPVEPGSPLAVAMITGDFDLSGIGTTTHVEGTRVFGWGHPFMSLGACQLPMFTGYIHTVYPRQTVSFKMGSPLREIGVMHADVSTCIAGYTDRKADMMPMDIRVSLNKHDPREYKLRVIRHRSLMGPLVFTALNNSIDLEGELPEEMTAKLQVRFELEGHEPILMKDTYSGFSGARVGPILFSQVGNVLAQLNYNGYKDLRVKKISADIQIDPERTSAEIEAIELDHEVYRPGETVRAAVFLRPYYGPRKRVNTTIRLPADLPEGTHTLLVCDEPASARLDIRANPHLLIPNSAENTMLALKTLLAAKRTSLAFRLPIGTHGVGIEGKTMSELPESMIRILSNSKRSGTVALSKAQVTREPTTWVIQGSESVSFRVSKTGK